MTRVGRIRNCTSKILISTILIIYSKNIIMSRTNTSTDIISRNKEDTVSSVMMNSTNITMTNSIQNLDPIIGTLINLVTNEKHATDQKYIMAVALHQGELLNPRLFYTKSKISHLAKSKILFFYYHFLVCLRLHCTTSHNFFTSFLSTLRFFIFQFYSLCV